VISQNRRHDEHRELRTARAFDMLLAWIEADPILDPGGVVRVPAILTNFTRPKPFFPWQSGSHSALGLPETACDPKDAFSIGYRMKIRQLMNR